MFAFIIKSNTPIENISALLHKYYLPSNIYGAV